MPEESPSPPSTAARSAPIKLRYWFVSFALLAVVGVWLANERSYARLQAYKQQLIAKGEKLAIADHIPKLPPASSNAAPDFLAAAARLTKVTTPFWVYQRALRPGRARVTWRCEELPIGNESDRWPELFAHAEDNRHLFAAISAALERPELVFDWDYAKGYAMSLPREDGMRSALDALANAIVADLRMGNSDHAFVHLLAVTRLAQLQTAPFGFWIASKAKSGGPTAVMATWEALQFPGWSDSQLRQLQAGWQSWDVREAWLATANMDRALTVDHFSRCRSDLSLLFPDILGHAHYYWDASLNLAQNLSENWGILKFRTWENSRLGLWRFGFSHDDELWILQHRQISLEETRAALAADAFGPARLSAIADYKRFHPHRLMMIASRPMEWREDQQLSLANYETARRITCTAIALHRHRLKHGKFPESLLELVPKLLTEMPRDFMDGQPLRYRLQPDGQFLLWSVGDDLKDDGGDPNHPRHSTIWNIPRCLDGRDWVWPQPATEAEAAAYHAALAARRLPAPETP